MSDFSVHKITGRVVQGHRVASGANQNPRFPQGTLRMQAPFFLERGLDLSGMHMGTLNVSIAPHSYRVLVPRVTFRQVKWHPSEPAEDFSFFDVQITSSSNVRGRGLIYYPHPETKPEHFQPPDMLELLLPYLDGLAYGSEIELKTIPAQMKFFLQTPH